jgi:hypothetical protein
MPNDHKPSRHKEGKGEKESTNRHVYIEPGAKIDVVDDLKEQRKTEREEDNATRDRQFKKQFIVTIVTVILIAIYTAVAFWQGHLTREFFEKDQRPYMSVLTSDKDKFMLAVTQNREGQFFEARASMGNFGKSPALHVIEAGEILTGDDPLKQADEWFQKMGTPLKKTYQSDKGVYQLQNTIGVPERNIMQGETAPFDAVQIKDRSKDIPPHPPAIIVGRIEYYDIGGNPYSTDICFMAVAINNPDGTPNTVAIPKCLTHNEIH